MLCLTLVKSPKDSVPPGQVFRLVDHQVHRIGRGSDCAVRIRNSNVSRHHAELIHIDGWWYLKDLGSRNGTKVNGQVVTKPKLLRTGDRINISMHRLLVALGETPAPMPASKSLSPAAASAAQPAWASGSNRPALSLVDASDGDDDDDDDDDFLHPAHGQAKAEHLASNLTGSPSQAAEPDPQIIEPPTSPASTAEPADPLQHALSLTLDEPLPESASEPASLAIEPASAQASAPVVLASPVVAEAVSPAASVVPAIAEPEDPSDLALADVEVIQPTILHTSESSTTSPAVQSTMEPGPLDLVESVASETAKPDDSALEYRFDVLASSPSPPQMSAAVSPPVERGPEAAAVQLADEDVTSETVAEGDLPPRPLSPVPWVASDSPEVRPVPAELSSRRFESPRPVMERDAGLGESVLQELRESAASQPAPVALRATASLTLPVPVPLPVEEDEDAALHEGIPIPDPVACMPDIAADADIEFGSSGLDGEFESEPVAAILAGAPVDLTPVVAVTPSVDLASPSIAEPLALAHAQAPVASPAISATDPPPAPVILPAAQAHDAVPLPAMEHASAPADQEPVKPKLMTGASSTSLQMPSAPAVEALLASSFDDLDDEPEEGERTELLSTLEPLPPLPARGAKVLGWDAAAGESEAGAVGALSSVIDEFVADREAGVPPKPRPQPSQALQEHSEQDNAFAVPRASPQEEFANLGALMDTSMMAEAAMSNPPPSLAAEAPAAAAEPADQPDELAPAAPTPVAAPARSKRWIWVMLASLILLGGLAVVAWQWASPSSSTPSASVPSTPGR